MSGFVAYGGPRPDPRRPDQEPVESILHPFRLRIFTALWIAALVSNIGTWMQNVGAAWLMTSLSPSPLMVALIQTASSLPILILALPAGALADIVDRRRLLIVSQAWMLLAAGALGWLTIAHLATPWTLLALSFALGVGSALNAPAWQAIVPELVTRSDLTAAISLNGINYNVARAVGPAIGGVVVAWAGAGPTFLLNAVSFVAVIAALYEWERTPRPGVLPAERVMGAVRAGIRYVRNSPALRAVLVQSAGFVLGASALWAVLPVLARWQMHLDAAGYGILLGFFGGGAVIGGALLPRLTQLLSRNSIVVLTTVAFALAMSGLALTRNSIVAFALIAMAGAAWVIAMSSLNVAAQISVPGWVQGRALACYQMVVQGGMAAGAILWGVVAERYSLLDALAGGSAAMIVGTIAMLRFQLISERELDLQPNPHWPLPLWADAVPQDSGPVLVTVEYRIDPARAREFEQTARVLRPIRMRDGATFWGLFFDASDPGRFVEYFTVESWIEHLRQHQRAVASDDEIEERVKSFHLGEGPPLVTHQISALSLDGRGSEAITRILAASRPEPAES
ncbi:MAG: MFS transporter [Candidatus Binataceae bacterium]